MKGITTAKEMVEYCTTKPMFRQVNQQKFIHAVTTRRTYHNLTRAEVDQVTGKKLLQERTVKTLEGVYIQWFLKEKIV